MQAQALAVGRWASSELAMAAAPAVVKDKKEKKKKQGNTKKKQPKDKEDDDEASGAGARFYKEVAQSICCKGITDAVVQNVCESIRKAIIRDVQKHGHFKLANIGVFRLKHVQGKPARKQWMYDRQTKGLMEKTFAATPPCKRLTGRALAPLKRIFREACEGEAATPVPSEQ